MCGRFTLTAAPRVLLDRFNLVELPVLQPRFNISPTQPVAAVRVIVSHAPRQLLMLHWGLIPRWAKDASLGQRLINARAETVAQKPAFRQALRTRRCLILADGFYEWQKAGRQKRPHYICLQSGDPFAFAGLWEHWHDAQGQLVESCTVLTTSANQLIEPIHPRMPVILPPEHYATWLDPAIQDPARLLPLLRPYPADELLALPVGPHVNNPRHDDPQCIQPLETTPEDIADDTPTNEGSTEEP